MHGNSVADFIQKNTERLKAQLHPEAAKPPIDPQAVSDKVAAQQAPAAIETKPEAPAAKQTDIPELPDTTAVTKEEPKSESKIAEEVVAAEIEEGADEESKSSVAINFKNMRKALNETKSKLTEKDTELAKAKEELERYKKGETLPEVVVELENKVQELSKYQKIVDLKASPEYQEKFVKPLSTLQHSIKQMATEYNIPEHIMEEALSMRSQRELNSFLSENFDSVGALEVKNLVNQINTIRNEALKAETEPETALQALIEEGEKARIDRVRSNKETIARTAKNAWIRSATKIRDEGVIPELIIRDDDTEYNEKVSKPILQAAATEYGKFVSMLADNGLEKLTEPMSDFVANMVLKGIAAHILAEQRNNAVSAYDRLAKNTEREENYYYPPVGGSPGVPPGKPVENQPIPDARTMARQHIEKIVAAQQKRG